MSASGRIKYIFTGEKWDNTHSQNIAVANHVIVTLYAISFVVTILIQRWQTSSLDNVRMAGVGLSRNKPARTLLYCQDRITSAKSQ